jgi:hypothetical protein
MTGDKIDAGNKYFRMGHGSRVDAVESEHQRNANENSDENKQAALVNAFRYSSERTSPCCVAECHDIPHHCLRA